MYVGVILMLSLRLRIPDRIPHVCGGDPWIGLDPCFWIVYSPCMWG